MMTRCSVLLMALRKAPIRKARFRSSEPVHESRSPDMNRVNEVDGLGVQLSALASASVAKKQNLTCNPQKNGPRGGGFRV